MLAKFINFLFCWRWWSNALKQDNQATPPQSSLTWIPYFLLALPAINISRMEWRNVLAFTEYLLCQGQGVFPLHPTRATKQRFTKVLRHESLISDLQRIEFAVFCDVLVQFLIFFYQAEGMNSNRLTKQQFSMLLRLEASIPTCSI